MVELRLDFWVLQADLVGVENETLSRKERKETQRKIFPSTPTCRSGGEFGLLGVLPGVATAFRGLTPGSYPLSFQGK